ncbi:MAG TPA: hypothetical protein VJ123_10075 [Anaerolineales bacterium]|nr:hypothetical protein [Anaerolineales bacterium]
MIGLFYRNQGLWYDALLIYETMYRHFIQNQDGTGVRIHKGMPLVWMSDCYESIANAPLAKRYRMLTLCEDAIQLSGNLDPVETGSYFRLAWRHGLSHSEVNRYSTEAYAIATAHPEDALYPEYVLQELDTHWLVEVPSANDAALYVANTLYVNHLLTRLGDPTGKTLERLADYALSCIPGCRTARRRRSSSTDYDIICSLQGPVVDFREEVGRYFVCECKDWASPADFSAFAKFCRVLDSVKARFGVIFSREGITGATGTTDAYLEQIKVFQDRGLVIAVVDKADLEALARGANFVSILREKYERVRLELRD